MTVDACPAVDVAALRALVVPELRGVAAAPAAVRVRCDDDLEVRVSWPDGAERAQVVAPVTDEPLRRVVALVAGQLARSGPPRPGAGVGADPGRPDDPGVLSAPPTAAATIVNGDTAADPPGSAIVAAEPTDPSETVVDETGPPGLEAERGPSDPPPDEPGSDDRGPRPSLAPRPGAVVLGADLRLGGTGAAPSVFTVGGGLRAGVRLPRVMLWAGAQVDRGRLDQGNAAPARLELLGGGVAIGAGMPPRRLGSTIVAGMVSGWLIGRAERLEARPTVDGVTGRRRRIFLAEPTVRGDLQVPVGPVRLGVYADLGVALPTPRANLRTETVDGETIDLGPLRFRGGLAVELVL